MTSLKEFSSLFFGMGSPKMEEVGVLSFFLLLGVSLLCSLFISFLYTYFYGKRNTGSQVQRAFPLLGISVTGIFICIQFSLPLSLGLLGALSIVRFRTPIKEPEEIGFIMLVITSSIACATFNMGFLAIILIVAVLGLLIMEVNPRFLRMRRDDGILLVSLPEQDFDKHQSAVLTLLEKHLGKGRLESIAKNNDQTIISHTFRGVDKAVLLELKNTLKHFSEKSGVNVFFQQAAV